MTNEAFQALLARGPVLLDGATGSNLMRAGMPRGICTEVWVTEHPAPTGAGLHAAAERTMLRF